MVIILSRFSLYKQEIPCTFILHNHMSSSVSEIQCPLIGRLRPEGIIMAILFDPLHNLS